MTFEYEGDHLSVGDHAEIGGIVHLVSIRETAACLASTACWRHWLSCSDGFIGYVTVDPQESGRCYAQRVASPVTCLVCVGHAGVRK